MNNQKSMKIDESLKEDIQTLNEIFKTLSYKERIFKLYEIFSIDEVLMTSSFGTHSVGIIHLLNSTQKSQKIYFVNTGYLFNETLEYKKHLEQLYNLNTEEIHPDPIQHNLTTQEKWWQSHPRMCCTINKIAPLEKTIAKHKVWISGLMNFQTQWRSNLNIFEKKGDIIKFHPLIDISEKAYRLYRTENNLPDHPLEILGYGSVGCKYCTIKGEGRSGRWNNSGKTECGLHQNFFYKKG